MRCEAAGLMYENETSCSKALLSAGSLQAEKANLAEVAPRAKAPLLSAEGQRDLSAGALKANKDRKCAADVMYTAFTCNRQAANRAI